MPRKHTTATKRKISASLRDRNAKVREALAIAGRLKDSGVLVADRQEGK